MTTLISNETGAMITEAGRLDSKVKVSRRDIAEGLYSEGYRGTDLGKDGKNPELRSELAFLYFAGLEPADRNLATADKEVAKQFGDDEKNRRRELQGNRGSFEGDIRRRLIKMEFPNGEADKVTAPSGETKASEVDKVFSMDADKIPQELIPALLAKMASKSLDLVQEWEEPNCNVVHATLYLHGLIDVLAGNKPTPIPAAKLK